MEQNEDKWLKAYRNRLDDYSEPVDSSVWDSLQKELNVAPVPARRIYPFRQLAVAATVLLALLSSVGLYMVFAPADEYMRQVVEVVNDTGKPLLAEEDAPVVSFAEQARETTPVLASSSSSLRTGKKASSASVNASSQEAVNSASASMESTPPPSADNDDPETPPSVVVVAEKPHRRQAYSSINTLAPARQKKQSGSGKWSVKLSAGNSLAQTSGTSAGFDLFSESSKTAEPYYSQDILISSGSDDITGNENNATLSGTRKEILLNVIQDQATTEMKHRIPVSFGLSGRYDISTQFAIETGVVYTLLSSELRSGSKDNFYLEENKFHYIGIPLKGSWTFVDRKRFSLYLLAGGTMDIFVAGKSTTENFINGEKKSVENQDLDMSALQWSLSAAFGAQYKLTEHFGVYAEPGIVHYFDDGSPEETIRTKKPTNFNLQLGLRFTY